MKQLTALAILTLATIACDTIGISPDLRGSPAQQHPLVNTSWFLREAPDVTIEFAPDNTVSGWTGCNSYDGRYKTRGDEVDFFDFQWTEAGCPTEYALATHVLLLHIIANQRTLWTIKESELRLTSSHSERSIRFRKSEKPANGTST